MATLTCLKCCLSASRPVLWPSATNRAKVLRHWWQENFQGPAAAHRARIGVHPPIDRMTPRCVDHSLSLSQQDVEKEPLFTGVIPESGCQTTDQFNGRTHVVVGAVDTRNPPYWFSLRAA